MIDMDMIVFIAHKYWEHLLSWRDFLSKESTLTQINFALCLLVGIPWFFVEIYLGIRHNTGFLKLYEKYILKRKPDEEYNFIKDLKYIFVFRKQILVIYVSTIVFGIILFTIVGSVTAYYDYRMLQITGGK